MDCRHIAGSNHCQAKKFYSSEGRSSREIGSSPANRNRHSHSPERLQPAWRRVQTQTRRHFEFPVCLVPSFCSRDNARHEATPRWLDLSDHFGWDSGHAAPPFSGTIFIDPDIITSADSTLELRDGNGELWEANDDWGNSPNRQAIIDSSIAPIDPREAAIVRSLAGNNAPYTAIVHGFNESRGIALVEVYALD